MPLGKRVIVSCKDQTLEMEEKIVVPYTAETTFSDLLVGAKERVRKVPSQDLQELRFRSERGSYLHPEHNLVKFLSGQDIVIPGENDIVVAWSGKPGQVPEAEEDDLPHTCDGLSKRQKIKSNQIRETLPTCGGVQVQNLQQVQPCQQPISQEPASSSQNFTDKHSTRRGLGVPPQALQIPELSREVPIRIDPPGRRLSEPDSRFIFFL